MVSFIYLFSELWILIVRLYRLLLGQVYKHQGSFKEAKESLLYAIDISDATPNTATSSFTSLFDQLPRFVA